MLVLALFDDALLGVSSDDDSDALDGNRVGTSSSSTPCPDLDRLHRRLMPLRDRRLRCWPFGAAEEECDDVDEIFVKKDLKVAFAEAGLDALLLFVTFPSSLLQGAVPARRTLFVVAFIMDLSVVSERVTREFIKRRVYAQSVSFFENQNGGRN